MPATHTVIYDGDCGLCRTLLALLLRADTRRRLRPLALQSPEADRLLADLTPTQRAASWHLVAPDGHRTSAGAAAPPLVRLLPGGTLPAAALATMPQLTERAYRLVADHRDRIGPLIPATIKRRATQSVARRTAAQDIGTGAASSGRSAASHSSTATDGSVSSNTS